MVYSSGISGMDPETGTIPDDPARQAELMFQNVRRFMEAAGGSPEDIVRVTVYLQDEKYRDLVNQEWVKMFPDPHSRPARHALHATLRNGAVMQVELVAVLP
ncbi:MAG: RidA family protein [Alicyclobacillus sp.]|nr:RidA family protein [Alicyclobacillus sp.]